MTTKVRKRNDIPAGMFSGTEVFVYEGKAYAMRNGKKQDYLDLPSKIRTDFRKAFFKDQDIVIQLWPKLGVTKSFIKWLECKCGRVDGTPDHNEDTGEIVADSNSFCGNCYCEGAGKLCKLPYDLKPEQVATIQLAKQGLTRQHLPTHLQLSSETIKSRLEKSRHYFGAHNAAHLASLTPLI